MDSGKHTSTLVPYFPCVGRKRPQSDKSFALPDCGGERCEGRSRTVKVTKESFESDVRGLVYEKRVLRKGSDFVPLHLHWGDVTEGVQ